MAFARCPKCHHHGFEAENITPAGSDFKLIFVKCSSCGTVVGVLDYYNIGSLILAQNKAIKKIAKALQIDVDLEP